MKGLIVNSLKGKRICCWADSAIAQTGFGTVSRHILREFHNAGMKIHHLAINFHGDFCSQEDVPWQQQPARLRDPRDPHGIGMFLQAVATGQYDYIWICNDLYVGAQAASDYRRIINELSNQGQKVPILLFYYPVDCRVPKDSGALLSMVDIPVCYNQYGYKETVKTFPHLKHRLKIIPHGTDTSVFYPLSKEERQEIRKHVLHVGDETTVIIQVNRNNARKDIPYSFLAFKKFRELIPNSIYYAHMATNDQGGDLLPALEHLGLSTTEDVLFPSNFNTKTPVPVEALNQLYNMGDMFLTCHLGEGHGLSSTESMAAGVPVVVPNNTSSPEIVGLDGERGYVYPCHDEKYIDPSGYRKKGLVPDIVAAMIRCYEAPASKKERLISRAREWTIAHDWKKITPQWITLLQQAKGRERQVAAQEI